MALYHNPEFGQPPKGNRWREAWKSDPATPFGVTLYQRGANGRFAVVYGKQVQDELSYVAAGAALGLALLHALACDGRVGNDGP